MVAKVGVIKVYDQKERLVNLITEGHHKPELRCEGASVAVTKLVMVEGCGRVERMRVAEERGKERGSCEVLNPRGKINPWT